MPNGRIQPGVVSFITDTVEHPEPVAEYADPGAGMGRAFATPFTDSGERLRRLGEAARR